MGAAAKLMQAAAPEVSFSHHFLSLAQALGAWRFYDAYRRL